MIPTFIKRRISIKVSDVITARQENRPYQYEHELINYTTNVRFSSTMPGGFAGCVISLIYMPDVDWTVMRPGNEVRIWDGGNIIYEGRVEDPGTITARSGSGFDVSCVGHIARLADDQIFRACFVDSSLNSWEDKDVDRDYVRRNSETEKQSIELDDSNNKFDTNCDYFNRTLIEDDDSETPNRMVISTIKGNAYWQYSSARKVYSFLKGMQGRNDIEDPKVITEKIRKIVFDYEIDLDTAGHWRAEIISRSNWRGTSNYLDDVFVRQCGYPTRGEGGIGGTWSDAERIGHQEIEFTGVNGLPRPSRCLVMRLVHAREDGGMTTKDADDNYYATYDQRYKFRINKMRVVGITNDYTPVTVRAVFEYVAAPLFNNFIADDYYNDEWADISQGLDHMVEDGPTDRAAILERANMVDVWDYAVWDWGNFHYSDPNKEQNRSGMNLYKSSFSDPACQWNVSLNYQDYCNEVLVRYTGLSGDEKELIYPANDDGYEVSTATRPLSGITRRVSIQIPSDGVVTAAFAKKVARRYLYEHSRPVVTGTVTVSAPLKTASGVKVEPWRIRAGQYLQNADLMEPVYGEQRGFGGRLMKIQQVDVDLASGTAVLTLGRRNSSKIDELFARMSAQNRRRWRRNKL